VRLPRNPRTRGVVILLVIVWATAVLGLLVLRIPSGRRWDVNWVTVAIWAAVIVWGVRRRWALRRTIALNDEPTSADGS
jgi:hypothetical protein